MNITLITGQLADIRDGKVYVTSNTLDIIRRFEYLGHIKLLCVKYKGVSSSNMVLWDNGVAIETVFLEKNRVFCSPSNRFIIKKHIKHTDLVIGYVPSTCAGYALLLAHRLHIKTLAYVVACPWDALWNHSFPAKFVAPLSWIRLKEILRKSDYALYVTNEFLQKRYPCANLTCGVSDVMLPIEDDSALKERFDKIKEFGKDGIIKLCTIANVNVRYKGHKYVFQALSKLKKSGDARFHYYLIGSGDQTYLTNLADYLDISRQIHFLGMIPHDEVFTYLRDMDVYIQPSLQEGLPRSVVEAMNRGLLCIGARTGAIPELLESEWIVERKSSDEIVEKLKNVSSDTLSEQAERNFIESLNYKEDVLSRKRRAFFDKIIIELNK